MASILSTSLAFLPFKRQSTMGGQILVILRRSSSISRCFNTKISCSTAEPETLEIVRSTIAKQSSIEETTVAPATKFIDLGADSLDTDAADLIHKVKTADAS